MLVRFFACQKSVVENTHVSSANFPIQTLSPTPSPRSDLPIRKIDFRNFTYPWTEDLSTKDEKTFTLKNGELPYEKEQIGVSLAKVEYGDLTEDGQEEALINLVVETGGTAIPNMVYIYTLENEKPRLIWNFETGDRADGGLKRVYAENGKMMVELFGDNKFENGEWKFGFPKGKFQGYCCPTTYTKIRFKWNGEEFAVEGKPELFDYDWKNRTDNQ